MHDPGLGAPAIILAAALLASGPAQAQIESAYTKLDLEGSCTVLDQPAEDEGGEWIDLLCAGYKGFPVFFSEGDLRQSVHYGFPPPGGTVWESFGSFNSVSDTIEWRLLDGRPFATIHRWTIDPDGVQVLVVEKVGQPGIGEGCVAAYVLASGNPDANVQARAAADRLFSGFDCASDTPVRIEGSVPLPPTMIDRSGN
ncbi:hypothetical protein [Hoeflea poritis]|uniref:Uncharacterized protein n=1 Tax=Hoeflea poritis TaxID=2993659 RepID=A0ABT4VRD9_9HYPH|nr:hypothetical protein [Hoeflea poritis]MDA4846750.1 hypothetical protein [Hoeflea poritis]